VSAFSSCDPVPSSCDPALSSRDPVFSSCDPAPGFRDPWPVPPLQKIVPAQQPPVPLHQATASQQIFSPPVHSGLVPGQFVVPHASRERRLPLRPVPFDLERRHLFHGQKRVWLILPQSVGA
jgi:hypothetical protein